MVGRVVFLVAAVIAASQPASADPGSGVGLDAPIPQYLAIGVGTPPIDGVAVSVQIGRQFDPHVDWFDELDAVVNEHGGVPTANNLTQLVLVTGARWMLFSTSPGKLLQLAAVYLKAGLALQVQPAFTSGPGLVFAAGYLPLQGAHWAVGAEARGDVGLAGSSQDGVTCMLVFELTN